MHRARDTTSLSTRSCYIYLEHLTSKFPIPTLNLNAPPHRFHRKNCKPCHHASKTKTNPHLSYPCRKCLSQQSGMHNYAVSGLSTTSYHCAHAEVVIRSRHARGCHPSPPATQAFNSRNAKHYIVSPHRVHRRCVRQPYHKPMAWLNASPGRVPRCWYDGWSGRSRTKLW